MNLTEMFQSSPPGMQDVQDDNTQPQLGDLRKTKLTLRQINKLRRMNDVRTFEYTEKLKLLKNQYQIAAQPPV